MIIRASKIKKKKHRVYLFSLRMRRILLFIVAAALAKDDFATLPMRTDQGVVTLNMADQTSTMRADFETGEIFVESSTGLCNTSKPMNFMFTDDGITSVAQMAKYTLRVRPASCGSQQATLGMRTADSPLWQIWTYASFSRGEIRLGRKHPKNAYSMQKHGAAMKCDGGQAERMCLLRNVTVEGQTGLKFDADFQAATNRIHLPKNVYMHYTSTSNCRSEKNSIATWPALAIRCGANCEFLVQAKSLVSIPGGEEIDDATGGCEYASNALRSSGKLVAHSDERLILLGSTILDAYTLDRDYIHNTMYSRVVSSTDHFSLVELFLLMYVFTMYVYYKTDPTDRNGAFLVGAMPLCTICKRPYIVACPVHAVRKALITNYVCVGILFAVAWYTMGMSSRIGVGIDETDLLIWAYVSLGVATLEYGAYAVSLFMRKTLNAALHWELVGVASVKSACGVALLSLVSVVRSDDLSSMLNLFVALFIIYDGLRRFVEDSFAIFSSSHQQKTTRIWWRIAWPLRTLVVSGGLGAGFTLYALTRHILYATILNYTFTTVLLLVCAYFAIVLNLECMHRAMIVYLRGMLAMRKSE